MPRPIGTLTIYATPGTKYFSDTPLELLDLGRVYKDVIQSFGHIDRSLAYPPGKGIRSGDAQVKAADTTREMRRAWARHTLERRLARIDLFKTSEVSSGADVDALDPQYAGEIVPGELPPGEAIINLRDTGSSWMDNAIPPLGTRDNWPDLPPGVETVFIPFRFGLKDSFSGGESSFLPQGACALPYLGPAYSRVDAPGDSTDQELILDSADQPVLLGFDYAVARHEVWDVMRVYRKTVTEGYFSLVDPSEYDIVVVPRTLNGITYNITVIRFLAQQDDGTLMRADISGVNSRGEFGESPYILTAITNEEIRNKIDHLVNFIYYIELLEQKIELFDSQSFYTVRQELIDRGILSDGDIDAANFDAPITPRKVIQAICNGLIDFKPNTAGRISVAIDPLTTAADSYTPSFSPEEIVEETFIPSPPPVTYNRVVVYYAPYGNNQWGYSWTIDNIDDQAELAQEGESSANVVRPFELYLPFISDDETALAIGKDFLGYFTLRSWIAKLSLKLPEWARTLDLGMLCTITHADGISEFASYEQVIGWVDEPFKIVQITDDLTGQIRQILAVRRYPSSELNLEATFNPIQGHPERGMQTSQPPMGG